MKALGPVLALAATLTTFTPSSRAGNVLVSSARDAEISTRSNPIRLEGQIRDVTASGEVITIRLHRDRYPIVTSSETRVRWLDGSRARAAELKKGDSIRVEGELDRNVIYADRVTILLRTEHHRRK